MKNMYSSEEADLLHRLDELFTEWKRVAEAPSGFWFIPDGFYPNYFRQNPRILYIGRDAHDLYGEDDENGETTYIEKFLPQYLSGKMGDAKRNINGVKFHKLLIEVAYGIIHECNWNQSTDEPSKPHVPYASEICGHDGKVFDRVSFAFMDLCKWSHESYEGSGNGTGVAWNAVDTFIKQSAKENRNFILDEISLLSPDIVISMNFGRELISRFSSGKFQLVDDKNENCFVYKMELDSIQKPVFLFDTWHFSGSKSEEKCIYNPLVQQIDAYWRKER